LTRLGLREIVALAQATGLAKLALAADVRLPRPTARARFEQFRRRAGAADPGSRSLARRDVRAFVAGRGRGWGRFGLVRLGRPPAWAAPYRARWALQHLPYSLARAIRPAIKDQGERVADWEGDNLRVAWDRLVDEGRLPATGGLSLEHRDA